MCNTKFEYLNERMNSQTKAGGFGICSRIQREKKAKANPKKEQNQNNKKIKI